MLKFLPLMIIGSWLMMFLPASSDQSTSTCPNKLEDLASLLIPQLPSYANRVIQRSRKLKRNYDLYSYVVVAGKPELQPLKLTNQQYTPVFPETSEQLFLTTLERKYIDNRLVETQNYHWIFLTYTSNGWKLVLSFSRFGSSFPNSTPYPIEETTHSVMGETMGLLLRDCEAGRL
jgi:hypothetical protein